VEPVRSAEPPTNSVSTGARPSIRVLRGLASGDGFRLAMIFRAASSSGQSSSPAATPATRRRNSRARPGVFSRTPRTCRSSSLERCAALFRVPAVRKFAEESRTRLAPADRRARRRDLLCPSAFRAPSPSRRASRGPLADHCFAADEAGFVATAFAARIARSTDSTSWRRPWISTCQRRLRSAWACRL